ncbi:MAG: SH3 domain-containing protein [Chlorobi bacterium]|nr:SH3 domain-containing protein [Chlorobiota bacterium]
MRKNHIVLFLFGLVLLSAKCRRGGEERPEVDVQAVIDSTGRIYAPDAREHVWEVKAERGAAGWTLRGRTDVSEAKQALLKTLKKKGVEAADSIEVLPLSRWREKRGVVRVSTANVRVQPDYKAELATQLLTGMPVEILEERDGFLRVRTPSGYLGWMPRTAVAVMDRARWEKWLAKPKMLVQVPWVRLTKSPDPESGMAGEAVMNAVLALVRKGDYFHLAEWPDGRRGYVADEAVVPLEEWHLINRELFSMRDFLDHLHRWYPGVPYMWGGTSIKALDCSGFTKQVFHNFGLLLPRDASQQYRIGREVPLDDELSALEAGDLLFFGPEEDTARITHVAIYLGGGRMMHASGEVKTESLIPGDSLYNARRRATLRAAKRLFGYYGREIYPYYTPEALKIYGDR